MGVRTGNAVTGVTRFASSNLARSATTFCFTADGDDAAEGTTLVTAYMHELNRQAVTLPLAVGEDHDRFQRSKAGWRVVSRRWEQLFTRPSS